MEKDEDQVGWSIWVADEDQVESAQSDIKLFIDDPTDKEVYPPKQTRKTGCRTGSKNFRKPSGFKHSFDLRKQWQSDVRKPGVYTLSLIITVVMVYLVSGMGKNALIINPLKLDLQILEGQIWEVNYSIFLHFNFFHIFFNMWWLYYLGSQLEKKKGHKFLLTFIFYSSSLLESIPIFYTRDPISAGCLVLYMAFSVMFGSKPNLTLRITFV